MSRDCRRPSATSIVPPDDGPLASGQSGVGRLAETASIVDAVVAAVAGRPIRAADPTARPPLVGPAHDADLEGRHLVVTAGGTREAIDPVRFIGNRSTGKMGVAVAEAALDAGRPGDARGREHRGRATGRGDGRPGRVHGRAAGGAPAAHPRSGRCRRLRRPGHGRRGRRLPAGRHGRSQARARGRHDPGPGADTGPARGDRPDRARPRQRGRLDPLAAPSPAGPGGLRRRDRVARSSGREAPAQGRRPAGGQRRGRTRLGLRDRHEPGRDPGRRRVDARRCPCCPSARSRTGSWTVSPPGWTRATRPRRLPTAHPTAWSRHECNRRHAPPPDGPRHREAPRGRSAHPDAHRVRLPDGPDPR